VAIKALIFDFDGVMLDTESPLLRSFQEIFEEHGAVLSAELWCEHIGGAGGTFDVYGHLETLIGRTVAREELQVRRRTRCFELIELEQVRPGVVRWLDDARQAGLACAVASSSQRAWVEEHLARHGLLDRFVALRCRDDVPRVKPAPDLYLAALDALALAPHQAIAIEDSPNGVKAARSAGLYCLAVPNEATRAGRFDQADLVIDSLEDLTLAELRGLIVERAAGTGGR
jgi:HAD superfamily hydrolase (TIGR01509 family)